jgi:hypothetical protein
VNELVEECRREWRRLRVPDQIADEMATDLAADLEEAQAEGGSAEDVLGSAAGDPRSLAAAWAAERGVVGRATAAGQRLPWIPFAIAALALVAIVGAVLLIRASAPERRALRAPAPPLLIRRSAPDARVIVLPAPAASEKQLANGSVWVSTDDVSAAEILMRDTSGSSGDTRTVGAVLSTVPLAGIVLLASLWLARVRRSRSA